VGRVDGRPSPRLGLSAQGPGLSVPGAFNLNPHGSSEAHRARFFDPHARLQHAGLFQAQAGNVGCQGLDCEALELSAWARARLATVR
jgi:hypothetical protein